MDVFATNLKELVSCNLIDEFNYKYRIVCPLSRDSSSCLQLTILLQYEHFDAYSEVLGSDATHDYLYPAMGKPIVDNRTFCYEAKMVENTTEIIDYANNFVYAGVWLRGNSNTSDSATMAWSIRNKERDYTKCHEVYCSSITTLLPEMLADKYYFYDDPQRKRILHRVF